MPTYSIIKWNQDMSYRGRPSFEIRRDDMTEPDVDYKFVERNLTWDAARAKLAILEQQEQKSG